jgi:hypothetical protein
MSTETALKRVRSPNYPSMSLIEAVQQIQKLFGKIGQHPAPRDSIATSMGYSGLHGASATAISALAKYGLIERQGEDYKLSERAMKIIAPHNASEKGQALQDAAKEPALFAELIEHFGGDVPTDEVLRPYLIRKGFAQAAVAGVIAAYRDTMDLVTREGGGYADPQASAAQNLKPKGDFNRVFDGFFNKPPAAPPKGAVSLMEGERIVFAHEIEPAHGVRVVASGEVDESLLDALDGYIKLHRKRLGLRAASSDLSPSATTESQPDATATDENRSSQVSFFITNSQKVQLRERGYSDDDIAKMKPAEAHKILGLA